MALTKATQNVLEGIVSTGSTGVSAGSFVVAQQYKITSLGTTTQAQWNIIAGTTGQTYVVGSLFTAATTGASSGTGAAAVARTLANRFADVINVKDFGAVGNGVTDDTAAIQAAINYAATRVHTANGLTLGVALQIPAGTYIVSALSVNEPIAIYGDGSAATRLYQKNNTNADLLVITDVDHSELHGICIDGNKANQPSNNGNGAFFDECYNVVMSDCEFRYCSGNGFRSFGGAYLTFDQCSFNNNYANGTYHTTTAVAVDDGTYYIRGSNSVAYDNGYDGFCYDPGSKSCTLVSCVSHDNVGTGFNVFGNISGIQPRQIVFSACIAENNYLEGFSCHSAYAVTITGCQSITNGLTNTGPRINGIIVSNDMAGQLKESDIMIADTIVVGPKGHGIYIDSVTADKVTNVMMTNVLIRNAGQNATNTWDGIYIKNADRVYMSNIYVKDDTAKMRYALTVASSSIGVHCVGGRFQSGLSGDFNILSTEVSITSEKNEQLQTRTYGLDKGFLITGNARPKLSIIPTDATGTTIGAVGRLYSREAAWDTSGLTNNINWNGNWILDDTAKTGWDVSTDSSQNFFQVRATPVGVGPRTMETLLKISGTSAANETSTWLLVNNSSTTTLKRVVVGAADSGGSGFRTLRVTN